MIQRLVIKLSKSFKRGWKPWLGVTMLVQLCDTLMQRACLREASGKRWYRRHPRELTDGLSLDGDSADLPGCTRVSVTICKHIRGVYRIVWYD